MNTPSTIPQVYDLAFFRSFFASKPESTWCVNQLRDGQGRYCANGHTASSGQWGPFAMTPTAMTRALIALLRPLGVGVPPINTLCTNGEWRECSVEDVTASAAINNGQHPRYQQPSPRARVLKAIDDLIAGKVKAS